MKKSINQKSNISRKKSFIIILLIGGILTGISYLFLQFYLAWFCLVPLFYILEKANTKQSFLYGLLYGGIVASIFYYWIIPIAGKYSGGFTFYSILFYCAAVIYFSLYFALFGMGYMFLLHRSKNLILAGISISGLFVLLELIKLKLFPGLPWLQYNLALTHAQNNWAIQWSAYGGFYIIIFFIVFFNYLTCQFLLRKEIVLLKTSIAVIVVFFIGGYLFSITNNEISDNKFNAVVLNENISAETRWNDLTGDSLANVFFKLNKEAVKYDPDLIIWSETAIPWKFEPDDQFIPRVLNITHHSKTDHLFGIFSPSSQDNNLVYNSAYLIKNDGRITDRYDKSILLDFLEKPFSSSLLSVLPFIRSSTYNNILPGKMQNVIKSGRAQIGVLICNESLSEEMYSEYIEAGANLLVLMSNDAWFENTPLMMHHFYITRMEAIMAGRDVIVNSNRGLVGIIRSDGDIEVLPSSNKARTINYKAHLSSKTTAYYSLKNYTIPFYLLLTIFPIFIRRK